jgi:hypothetical protein
MSINVDGTVIKLLNYSTSFYVYLFLRPTVYTHKVSDLLDDKRVK